MIFSEDSRVKIPCILHLIRLGYQYLSLKEASWDDETNIFLSLFQESISRINPGIESGDVDRLLTDVKLVLDNEDLGRAFYEKLTERSGIKLIDFSDFANNSFHVVTELTCKNGDDEFRPDITLLINGMPLVFIEVKKPNNREGILAERKPDRHTLPKPAFPPFYKHHSADGLFKQHGVRRSLVATHRVRLLRLPIVRRTDLQLFP